jgi:hypothetical protein
MHVNRVAKMEEFYPGEGFSLRKGGKTILSCLGTGTGEFNKYKPAARV